MIVGTTRIRPATVVTITIPETAIIISASAWDANFFGIIYKFEKFLSRNKNWEKQHEDRIIYCLKAGDVIPEDTRIIGSGIVLFNDWVIAIEEVE